MADWLDSDSIAQRTRNRILGHASGVRGRYGRKGVLDLKIAAKIEALEPPVIKRMRDLPLAAKDRANAGELTVPKTCCNSDSSSQIYCQIQYELASF